MGMRSRNVTTSLLLLFLVSLDLTNVSYSSSTWIKSGYWDYNDGVAVNNTNSALFTHLICAFAHLDSSNYTVSLPQNHLRSISTFSATVRQANPSVVTLLSIGGGSGNASVFSAMVAQPARRSAFIDSAAKTASAHGFDGLDLSWPSSPNSTSDMLNLGVLFQEWRRAAAAATSNTSRSLILTMAVHYTPNLDDESLMFPVESMRQNLDWVHVMAQDYYAPSWNAFTAAHAALYNPRSPAVSTQSGVEAWVARGMPAEKMVLCMPFYGYSWKLADPQDKSAGVGAPALRAGAGDDGFRSYKYVRDLIRAGGDGAAVKYDGAYVVNYAVVGGYWIGYDDVEAIRAKVRYAKDKGMLGYTAWQVGYDDNSALSAAADGALLAGHGSNKTRIVAIALVPTVSLIVVTLVGFLLWRKKLLRKLETEDVADLTNEESLHLGFGIIRDATDDFSDANKLGQGGFGAVYKGKLVNGQEIAVKRLSMESGQGDREFRNEVLLLAKLQHKNLVKLLGCSLHRNERLLVYEYLPNGSLDHFIFDPVKRLQLKLERRCKIIQGIARGLLYLHEESRLKIIHCDLKASNILLDKKMNPQIADFGMARLFEMDQTRGSTNRIAGTMGYMAPEYQFRGQFSVKSDVFSFGVLVLEILSGQMISRFRIGESSDLLGHTWRSWRDGTTLNMVDPSLGDGPCWEIMRCIHIGLLCVQENMENRPAMASVVLMLSSKSLTLPMPSQPAFYIHTSTESQHKSEQILQSDEATMSESELYPR